MTHELLTRRHLQAILALVVILGTATLAILALGVLLLAALVLKTLFDCLVSIVQTVNELVATGGPFARLLLLAALLYLAWKGAPRVMRFFRSEMAWMQAQFTQSGFSRSGPAPEQRQDENESEPAPTVEGTISPSSNADQGQRKAKAGKAASPTRNAKRNSARTQSRSGSTLPAILKHLAAASSNVDAT